MGYKYDLLGALLKDAAARGDRELQLHFDDIDELVGGLPASARKYREWWANSGQPQSIVWRGAGWRVAGVNQSGGNWVRFEREGTSPPSRSGAERGGRCPPDALTRSPGATRGRRLGEPRRGW